MNTALKLTASAVILATAAFAQTPSVDVGGVVNVASYAYADLPSGPIAPGSIFGIFGKNLGPTPFAQASGYPIPTTLGGTTVKVTSGATTANALLFLASSGQINALLPSSIPAGNATLTVTANGLTSAAAAFKVGANSFGTFSLNAGGSGPGAITNPAGATYGLTKAANPDEPAVIYGTGLGAVQGNEAGGALPGDMPSVPVEVYVGNVKAAVSYRGRSGCCAGLDQITFTVPAVTGCRVPVVVKINNVVSNYTTLAIAPKGTRTCSDPTGPSASDLQKFQTQGSVAIGGVILSRINSTITVPNFGTITTNIDTGGATFQRLTAAQLDLSNNPFNTYTVGSCTVYYYKGSSAAASDPTSYKFLDAGAALSVNGPNGSKQLTKTVAGNSLTYVGVLSTPTGLTGGGYLDPGNYTISGPGGPDVGGFNTQITLAAPLVWANQDAITDITRANGQQIKWSGGDPAQPVQITGSSLGGTAADSVGAGFTCFANGSDGQFTIPATVLLAMPPSVTAGGVPTGSITVGATTAPKAFAATGLDQAFAFGAVYTLKSLNFK